MTSFEKHLGRPMKPNERTAEREYYVSLILTPERLKERRAWLERENKPKKLALFETE